MRSFEIPFQFRSQYISRIKEIRKEADKTKKDLSPSVLSFEKVDIILPRHFGFCFGVQNAIERAYEIVEQNPDKNIYLISEMIHNPDVNGDLQEKGIQFIQDTKGNQLIPWDNIQEDDIVIVPAFGTTNEIESILSEKNIRLEKYDTTCPFVERVWNKGEKLGKEGYTIVIHGDAHHEETRATASKISAFAKTVIVSNYQEADILKAFILQSGLDERDWGVYFKWKASEGFNFRNDLDRIAVVNQTTMLAEETQKISNYMKDVMIEKHGSENIDHHFGSTRDTLCYATNDNQMATLALLNEEVDVSFVIGGINSSNTKHLAEILNERFRTFYIQSEQNLENEADIRHFDFVNNNPEQLSNGYIPEKEHISIAISSGASCPDVVVERVMMKLLSFTDESADVDAAINQLQQTFNGL